MVSLTPGPGDTATASSPGFGLEYAGTWCIAASYTGDSNYSPSIDDSADGCFVATRDTIYSIQTMPVSSSIVLGSSNSEVEMASCGSDCGFALFITGTGGVAPSGTIQFYECGPTASPAACTSEANPLGQPRGITPLGNDETSLVEPPVSFTPTSTGYWCFAAYYSGDGDYYPTADTSTSECFDVTLPALQVATTSLPASSVRSRYSASLAAVGGNSPYKWSVMSGALPLGLHLKSTTGVISGEPKRAGTYTFTIKVVDHKTRKTKGHPSTQNTATKVLSITIS
jgi:hypothetical protein